jgi:ATP-dependent metalloprotease FtsH
MNFEKLIDQFFEYRNVKCDDFEIDSDILQQSDVFLPVILGLIEKVIHNTSLEDRVFSVDLVKKEQSLCFVQSTNLVVKSQSSLMNILEELGGFNVLNNIFIEDDGSVQIEGLSKKLREKLNYASEGEKLTQFKTFDTLFKLDPNSKLSNKFIEIQLDILNNETWQELTEQNQVETKAEEQERISVFSITNNASAVCELTQQLLHEVSVLAAAQALTNDGQADISNIKKKDLPDVNSQLLLAAAYGVPECLALFAEQYQCQAYQLVLPEAVYNIRKQLTEVAVTRSFTGSGDSSKTWYEVAKTYVKQLSLTDEVQQCFNKAFINGVIKAKDLVKQLVCLTDTTITVVKKANHANNRVVKAALTGKQLADRLNQKVIGQHSAVHSLYQGYLANNTQSNQGPRLIYTFAGPSGVGKTYLAQSFSKLLNQFEHSGYVFNTFNMEHYCDERDVAKLFGSGKQYTDASLGLLTSKVRAQPRQILLFDEIEKAHPRVIQSLLTLLDSGIAKDQTSDEQISFSQCIVIFTTNLGQELLEKNTQNHRVNVFDMLRKAQDPANKTKLSYEFVNRLAKGYPVLFEQLKTNHLVRLAEKEVTKHSQQHQAVQYNWPDNITSFMLQSIAPEVTARQISTVVGKLQSSILQKSTSYFTENIEQVVFDVKVTESKTTLSKTNPNILLLDDDAALFDNIKAIVSDSQVALCHNVSQLSAMLLEHRPEALLIDIETIDNNSTLFEQILADIQQLNPKLPLFTYRVKAKQLDTFANSIVTDNCHDIREHFTLVLDKLADKFPAMLKRIQYYIQLEHDLSSMIKRNESLAYRCYVKPNETAFEVSFNNLSRQRLIHSDDLTSDLFAHSLPENNFNDVIGLERAKKRLTEVVGWLKSPQKLANFGIKLPSGFLFAGPPGTGKTLLAKALAGECGLPFFSVSAAELSSPVVGGTTENIKKLFATARKYAPAIVFIDEIDAIARQRTNNSDTAAQNSNLAVNALLTEMDGFTPKSEPVFVLAATNLPQLLDSAVTRPGRFDETIYCDLPNKQARAFFFELFANKHQLSWSASELKQLVSSSQGMSSAEIEQVLREAIYQAVGDEKALSCQHIKQSMIRIVYGSPSNHIRLSKEEKRRTAYHEAAHLLAYKLLFPKQRIDFVTIEPRNQALGFVATCAAEEYESYSKVTVMNKLQVLLAGRVAEKLCSGSVEEISTGASNDIEKATQLAMHAIYEGGIEPSVGPINIAMITKFEESDLLATAQLAVKQWLEDAEQKTEQLLTSNYPQLALVAEALLDKESLLADEINQLFDC